MISVTVAAHGHSKAKRVIGAHLRVGGGGGCLQAYGSGRLSICDLNNQAPTVSTGQRYTREKRTCTNALAALFFRIHDIFWKFVYYCFPFIHDFFYVAHRYNIEEARLPRISLRLNTTRVESSQISALSDDLLCAVFRQLDAASILVCERVCKRWKKVTANNLEVLAKFCKDQVKLLFDEGEIILYPVDEKLVPRRYPMPSLQTLRSRLKHLNTNSLYLRGLIPVESTPVLTSLCSLNLNATQIYFIWCKFSADSIPLLERMLVTNEWIADLGFEECAPTSFISDAFLAGVIKRLVSLRIWHEGHSTTSHTITNLTLQALSESIADGRAVETIDLAGTSVDSEGVTDLITSWAASPQSDLSLSFNFSSNLNRASVISTCREHKLFFKKNALLVDGYRLTLFC